MIQAGNSLGLAPETLPPSGIVGEARRKNLDGNGTLEALYRAPRKPRPPRAEPPAARQCVKLVGPDGPVAQADRASDF